MVAALAGKLYVELIPNGFFTANFFLQQSAAKIEVFPFQKSLLRVRVFPACLLKKPKGKSEMAAGNAEAAEAVL